MKLVVRVLPSMIMLSSILAASAADSLNITIHKGEDFTFNCCEKINKFVFAVSVRLPNGEIYTASKEHTFENKKVLATVSDKCEVKIKKANLEDNGIWKCYVSGHDGNLKGSYTINRNINITLLEPHEQGDSTLVTILSLFGIIALFLIFAVCYACNPKGRKAITIQDLENNQDNNSAEIDSQEEVPRTSISYVQR